MTSTTEAESARKAGHGRVSASPGTRFARRFGSLFPNYFAMIMATGIVSVAAQGLGHERIGWALFLYNILAYVAIWIAGAVRLAAEGGEVFRQAARHATGPGFLTIVAGTAVLGSEFAAFGLAPFMVPALFGAAVLFWFAVLFAFLAGVTSRRRKPSLRRGLTGQWLLIVVATQSLPVLGSDLLRQTGGAQGLAFVCYALLLSGAMSYLTLAPLVFYRFAFLPMEPDDLGGPWWINEGASAITLLAGTKLMNAVPGLHVGAFEVPRLLSPLMLAFWAEATFWIPLLLLLFAWKYFIRRAKAAYTPGQWSIVFPLGMYAASTLQAARAFELDFLKPLAAGFFWLAFLIWLAAMAGALRQMTGVLREARD